jgi:mxaA protein
MVLVNMLFINVSMAEERPLTVTVDRPWGLLLGDEINVKVDLVAGDEQIDESSLPQENKRYGTWLYLRTIDITAKQLIFHYQLVNVPLINTTIATPKFDIKRLDDMWLVVPTTSLTIGPALAVTADKAASAIKADMEPTLISTETTMQQLKLSTAIAVLAGMILALWHFGWKTKNRKPFSQAVHDLSRLKWHHSVTADDASRILHTAFNHTAGTVVVYGEIDKLLQLNPWLMSMESEIKQFYQQSEQHFFARKPEQGPETDAVRKLAKACRSKEMLA